MHLKALSILLVGCSVAWADIVADSILQIESAPITQTNVFVSGVGGYHTEAGDQNPYQTVVFARFPLEWLTEGKSPAAQGAAMR